jgi:hypothetical protein
VELVAVELGHATSHMVVSNYDSFLDPRTWPDAEEIERLRAIYGWSAVEDRAVVAPVGHPMGASGGAPEDGRPKVGGTEQEFWPAARDSNPRPPGSKAGGGGASTNGSDAPLRRQSN